MSLAQFIGRTALRRVIWIVVGIAVYALLSLVGIGKAHAQDPYVDCYANIMNASCPDQGVAYTNTSREARRQADEISGITCPIAHDTAGLTYSQKVLPAGIPCSSNTTQIITRNYPSNKKCTNRPARPGSMLDGAGQGCHQGCIYNAGPTNICLNGDCNSNAIATGAMAPTAGVCLTPPTPKPRDDDFCISTGGGYQQCARSDGKTCIVSPSGTAFCWNPGDSGCKVSGKEAGCKNTPTPPTTPPPPNPDGTPNTWEPDNTTGTTETTGGSTTNNTFNNHNSTGGSNPGGPGGPGDGGDGEDGDDEEDDGTSAGGGDCDAAPISQGGDQLLHMMIQQQWLARCAAPDELPDSSVAGEQGPGGEHPEVDSIIEDGGVSEAIGDGGDSSGFGLARSCPLVDMPVLTLRGESVDLPLGMLCDVFAMIGALVLLAGHIQWALIIAQIGAV